MQFLLGSDSVSPELQALGYMLGWQNVRSQLSTNDSTDE